MTKGAFPILRYWTNDICSIDYDQNGKRTHIKMSSIKGRADDMLIIRGVNLFHTQVEEVIHEIDFLSPNYRLIVDKKGPMDMVTVEVETTQGTIPTQDLNKLVCARIKNTIGLSMQVDFKAPNSIPRSQGGKLSRIIDKRN